MMVTVAPAGPSTPHRWVAQRQRSVLLASLTESSMMAPARSGGLAIREHDHVAELR